MLLHRFEEGFDVTSHISRLDTERNMVSPGHGSGPLAWRAASHPHPWTHTQTTRAGPAFGTFQRAQEKNKSAIQFSACDSALFWPLSRSLYRMKPSTVSRLFRSSFEKIATRLKSPFEKSLSVRSAARARLVPLAARVRTASGRAWWSTSLAARPASCGRLAHPGAHARKTPPPPPCFNT